MIRAALITKLGNGATFGSVPAATPVGGESDVTMEAAALNPADRAISEGRFYGGYPEPPYVPGLEAVGRIGNRRVYVSGAGLGIARDGLMRDSFAAPDDTFIEIPENIEAATAVALGTAGLAGWLPMEWRAAVQPGETVLVLGATGFAGTVAVQAARHIGARRVIAAGRNRARLADLERFADATVALDDPDLAAAFIAACGKGGAQVIYDCLWGEPLGAALQAASLDGRVVHVGASAGPTANLASAAIRGKRLSVLGYSNFGVPRRVFEAAYLKMLDLASNGSLKVQVQEVPLEQVAEAWAGLLRGDGKYVVIP
jgi:NADPH:quinone reductase-like Zn-dependent oxidoreductase